MGKLFLLLLPVVWFLASVGFFWGTRCNPETAPLAVASLHAVAIIASILFGLIGTVAIIDIAMNL